MLYDIFFNFDDETDFCFFLNKINKKEYYTGLV